MPIRLPIAFLIALAAACCALAGCGHKGKTTAQLDASEILDLIQNQRPAEARNYIEVEMGKFRISHALEQGDGQVLVEFKLYGVVPQQRKAKFEELLPQFEKRVRDAVISLVQRIETEHLTDPALAFFKTEVVAAINRVLQDRLLQDVAFSDFSIERG
jgi:hypothetical protein